MAVLAYDALQWVFVIALLGIIGGVSVFALYLIGRFFVNPGRGRRST